MLMAFGLTRQEATLYSTLAAEGSLTGYEAAKLTGISRSNAYTALAGLVEKGAADVIESDATHYVPVPVAEFCQNKLRRLTGLMDSLKQQMPQVRTSGGGFVTLRGAARVLDHCLSLIESAERRIYLSASGATLEALLPALCAAVSRGLKVVLLTDARPHIKGAQIYHAPARPAQQIRLITDSSNVLTGAAEDANSTGLFSREQNLVDLIKDAFTNEMQLIRLKDEPNIPD